MPLAHVAMILKHVQSVANFKYLLFPILDLDHFIRPLTSTLLCPMSCSALMNEQTSPKLWRPLSKRKQLLRCNNWELGIGTERCSTLGDLGGCALKAWYSEGGLDAETVRTAECVEQSDDAEDGNAETERQQIKTAQASHQDVGAGSGRAIA